MKIVSIFNNKGGVGKTTYMFHIANVLAELGKRVLVIDLDSQCNISSYMLSDRRLSDIWNARKSIWDVIHPLSEGLGDFAHIDPVSIIDNKLYLTPGDILLSDFEDTLGDTWSRALGGEPRSLRVQSAFYRYSLWAADCVNADVVMFDLGPNLGAINRSALSSSDYFIVPMAPDLFSIRGTENLGNKLLKWKREWIACSNAYSGGEIELPNGTPQCLGYVMQQYNVRTRSKNGMTKGWAMFSDKAEEAILNNIIIKITDEDSIEEGSRYRLGQIPNLHSLIPYSQKARIPVYKCTSKNGLTGQHITTARNSYQHFLPIAKTIKNVI